MNPEQASVEKKSHSSPNATRQSSSNVQGESQNWSAGLLAIIGLALVGFVYAWARGLLRIHEVPDSPSYLEFPFGSWQAAMSSIRTPGYPLFLAAIRSTVGLSSIPIAQVALHVIAAWALWLEIRSWGLNTWVNYAAAFCVLLGCTFSNNVHTVSTDAPAASLGVLTAVMLLRWLRTDFSVSSALGIVFSATIAISLRPAYLFLIPWMGLVTILIGLLLKRSLAGSIYSTIKIVSLAAVPVLLWMAIRLVVVGQFGIAAFGHQNLSGVLVQLVSQQELDQLESAPPELIEQLKQDRAVLLDRQPPLGFETGPGIPTMTLDRQWHDVMYQWIVPATKKLNGDDAIAHHRSLQQLNSSIIRAFPERYGIWLLKATRQAVWTIFADLLMHPLFLFVSILVLIVGIGRAVFGSNGRLASLSIASRALFVVAFTYAACKVGFVILSSPPIGRFSDAAAIFIPASLLVLVIEACGIISCDTQGKHNESQS